MTHEEARAKWLEKRLIESVGTYAASAAAASAVHSAGEGR